MSTQELFDRIDWLIWLGRYAAGQTTDTDLWLDLVHDLMDARENLANSDYRGVLTTIDHAAAAARGDWSWRLA
jgi:hypothetical protein